MQYIKAGLASTDRAVVPNPSFRVDVARPLALAVAVAAATLAVVDFVAGVVLGVTDMPIPRVIWAAAHALWAYREWRRPRPALFPLLVSAAVTTAVASVLTVIWSLPFGWYDQYTAYGILVTVAVASAVLDRQPSWLRLAVLAGPAVWAFSYGLLSGQAVKDVLDWVIVTTATVFVLHFMVKILFESASAATRAQAELVDLHRALARCSQVLLEDASEDALDVALAALLEATAADCAYVDRTIYEGEVPGWEIIAAAYSDAITDDVSWMRGSYTDLPTMLAAHRAGQVCEMRRDALTGREREVYEKGEVAVEVSVPVFVDGVWRGCLSLVSSHDARQRSDLEVDMLVQAAALVSAYWRRQDDHHRLEELVRSKDELVASVSHELRTPLTAVVGLAEEMAASAMEFDRETLAELAAVVAEQSRELAHLVEDLLVAARVESGGLTVQVTEFDLRAEAETVVAALGLEVPVRGQEAVVAADPLRCRQIIRNLLTNAKRYGGDHIEIRLASEADRIVLSVVDDGDGVPEEDAKRIFDAYVRGHEAVAPGSVGIGLAVSRNLADLMGGALEYRRRDGLTEFHLVLPSLDARESEPVVSPTLDRV